MCDGSSVLRASYSGLFTAIGTAWGSVDGTHFNVPDLRGVFLRGTDGGAARDPDRAARTAIATGGNTGDAVGSVQTNATKKNGLTATMSGSVASGTANLGTQTANHTHNPNNMQTSVANSTGSAAGLYAGATFPFTTATTIESTNHSHNDSGHAHTVGTLAATINNGDNETRPLNANVNYIIKI